MWLSPRSLQAPCVAKVVWYQHLVPCLIPTGHRLPASLHPGLAALPTPEGSYPPLWQPTAAAGPPTGTALLPSTAFRSQIQAQQQDTFPSPGGMPAFQAKGTHEVWPKEAAAPFQFPWQCCRGAAVTCGASQTTELLR